MQENHGLYMNRTEPIHLMTEVTSVLGSTIKYSFYSNFVLEKQSKWKKTRENRR